MKGVQTAMFGVPEVRVDPSSHRREPSAAAQLWVARLVDSLPIGTRLTPLEHEVRIATADPSTGGVAARARLVSLGFERVEFADQKTVSLGEVTFWRAFALRWADVEIRAANPPQTWEKIQ